MLVASAQVGYLRLAGAAPSWLAIQDMVKGLLAKRQEANARLRTACRGQRLLARGTKTVVVKAIKALGGKVTKKEVSKFLRQNPSMYEGTDVSNMERAIERIRLAEYCEPQGKNQHGEEVFVLPDGPCPKGVKRQKTGFTARMNLAAVKSCCIGPLRAKAEHAKKDYEKLQKWRAAVTADSLVMRVRAWGGARVTKWCGGKGPKSYLCRFARPCD